MLFSDELFASHRVASIVPQGSNLVFDYLTITNEITLFDCYDSGYELDLLC